MIWVRKTENEMGGYADAEGVRYTVEWCVKMVTHDGSTEADHGYERHESVQSACGAWGLTVWVDPNAEAEFAQLTEEATNNESGD